MNPKTKDLKDWNLFVIMGYMRKNNGRFALEQKKWIILDWDVDPKCIKTMNKVMDDNKMLSLVSKKRIPLKTEMR